MRTFLLTLLVAFVAPQASHADNPIRVDLLTCISKDKGTELTVAVAHFNIETTKNSGLFPAGAVVRFIKMNNKIINAKDEKYGSSLRLSGTASYTPDAIPYYELSSGNTTFFISAQPDDTTLVLASGEKILLSYCN